VQELREPAKVLERLGREQVDEQRDPAKVSVALVDQPAGEHAREMLVTIAHG
jgi:hypothetical protein